MKLAADLPATLSGPGAWRGEDIARLSDTWRWHLSPTQIAELEAAARAFVDAHGVHARPARDTFALPSLHEPLTRMREALIHGRGFEVIRGLPVEDFGESLASIIFVGIGAHLGDARSQNAAGDLLGHVRDIGASSTDPNTRIYQTTERQTFHTDSADVVGLLCLSEAREGGDSMLVSASSIYNEMRREHEGLLPWLFDDIATDRRGEVPPGANPWFTIPVFNWYDGSLTVMYQRQYIDSAQRFAAAPRLTAAHIEALDCFDRLANDPALHVSMRLAPGDMQFVHNHSLLHDRTAFVDYLEPHRRRHLLRLWLAIPGDRALPPCFAQRYGSITVGDRGGVVVDRAA